MHDAVVTKDRTIQAWARHIVRETTVSMNEWRHDGDE